MGAPETLQFILERNHGSILEEWIKEASHLQTNLKDDIMHVLKGQTIDLFIHFLNNPEFLNNNTIFVEESIDDDISFKELTDLVEDLNIGRRVILLNTLKSRSFQNDYEEDLIRINSFFDELIRRFSRKVHSELEKKSLVEQLKQNDSHNDRLTLLGQMSSSFVHEFRNPLTSIIGFVKLLKADYPNTPYLKFILHEAEQLNDRISQFLALSKKDVVKPAMELFDPKELVYEVKDFLYPTIIDSDITLDSLIQCGEIIYMSKTELRQILINIIMNAIEAVRFRENRVISLKYSLEDTRHVFTVKNSGPRIDEDKITRIFEPFYTTKDVGTGIGLYICQEIIKKYDGSITCNSDDLYTTFSISIPKESISMSLKSAL